MEPFKTLLDLAISLLQEGAKNRKNFFNEVVIPINQQFELLKTHHDEAFRLIFLEFNNEIVDINKLIQIIESRQITEAYDWLLFAKKIDLKPRVELNLLFQDYLQSLRMCFFSVHERGKLPDAFPVLGFYHSLSDVFRRFVPSNIYGYDGTRPGPEKSRFQPDVNSIHREYAEYCSEVQFRLLQLRRACLV